jgi:hypothetical protein
LRQDKTGAESVLAAERLARNDSDAARLMNTEKDATNLFGGT